MQDENKGNNPDIDAVKAEVREVAKGAGSFVKRLAGEAWESVTFAVRDQLESIRYTLGLGSNTYEITDKGLVPVSPDEIRKSLEGNRTPVKRDEIAVAEGQPMPTLSSPRNIPPAPSPEILGALRNIGIAATKATAATNYDSPYLTTPINGKGNKLER